MRILYENISALSGALASYKFLLRALATSFPEDHYFIYCHHSSGLESLAELSNVTVLLARTGPLKEAYRLYHNTIHLPRLARRNNIDVIWSTNTGPYVRSGIPQVLSVLNSFQVYPWDVTRFHPKSALHVAFLRWFFRYSLRRSEAVIVETELLKQYVATVAGAPSRIAVIPKAVETGADVLAEPLPEQMARSFKANSPDVPFTFLYVATALPHKNHRLLVDVMDLLRSKGVVARLALSISEQELLRIGGRRASDLIGSGHLLPLGWIDKQYLRSLYDNCDACVMPSLLECMSSAHLEAMEWGKPQVSADLPYARDLCQEATLYADVANPLDWANKMCQIINDAELRAELAHAGHQRMRSFPRSWSEVAGRVRAFFDEVVASQRQRGML